MRPLWPALRWASNDLTESRHTVDADLLLIPRTTVGRWMAAGMLGERQLAAEQRRRLNRGLPGWNDDEPGVMRAACEIAMRRCFRPGYDVRDVAGFTKWICKLGGVICQAAACG